jgi:hypothetical protein
LVPREVSFQNNKDSRRRVYAVLEL